jgi:hypothetical protein
MQAHQKRYYNIQKGILYQSLTKTRRKYVVNIYAEVYLPTDESSIPGESYFESKHIPSVVFWGGEHRCLAPGAKSSRPLIDIHCPL